MIIETTSNQVFKVEETGNPNLAHVWFGIELNKRTKEPKKGAKKTLVSKAHLWRVL